jgi:hypothetical protein
MRPLRLLFLTPSTKKNNFRKDDAGRPQKFVSRFIEDNTHLPQFVYTKYATSNWKKHHHHILISTSATANDGVRFSVTFPSQQRYLVFDVYGCDGVQPSYRFSTFLYPVDDVGSTLHRCIYIRRIPND